MLPLRQAGHPLGSNGDWYHEFAKSETALFPELKHTAGSRLKHYGHVKSAVLHGLERMLAEVLDPPESEPAEPAVQLVTVIPPPEPVDPAAELEYILWKLGADQATVDHALGLAFQVQPA
jgi:hypothetical protein